MDELFLTFPTKDKYGVKDYSFSDCIYQLQKNNLIAYSLNNKSLFAPKREIPVSKERLEGNYISVKEFLNTAEYIGKKAKRTKPTVHGDASTFDSANGHYTIMLYRGKSHLIIEEVENTTGRETRQIRILDENYADDGWEYMGEQIDTYRSPEDMLKKLYDTILVLLKEKDECSRRLEQAELFKNKKALEEHRRKIQQSALPRRR